jgi:hypothetical protein
MIALLSRIPRSALLLALIALGLYLPGFWWGAPHATAPDRVQSWGVDDGTPLQPLADVHNILRPKPDRNYGYPLMHSFVLTAAYSPYLGWLWLTGQFTPAAAAAYPFGLADPVAALRTLTLIGRLVSVLMGVGIVVAVWDAARALWGERTAVVAALMAMSLFPMFYYARVGNPDVPVLFYSAVALAAFTRSIAGGFTLRRAIVLGVFVGFAVGTKEPMAAAFLGLPFALLYLLWREGRAAAGWLSWGFWKPPVACAFAAFIAFGAGSGLFVDPKFYLRHVEFSRERVATLASANIAHVRSYPYTWEGHWDLAVVLFNYLADCMTLAGVVLALAGVLWVLRREPRAALLALPAVTYLGILFWSARAGQLRYLFPAALILAFFAARAAVLAWESRHLALRGLGAAIAVLVIGLGLLRGVDLTHAMVRDSRYAAAAWLATHAPAGTTADFFGESGELPPLASGVATTRTLPYFGAVYKHDTGPAAVQAALDAWRARHPDLIILLPDHSSRPGEPYNATCPPEIYAGLLRGAYGYELAAFFETPPLLPWVRRPNLDYPSVNPPIRIFTRKAAPATASPGGAP